MANTYLTKNFGSAGTRTKYTISVWVKRSKVGATQCIFSAGTGANNSMTITFNGNDTLYWNSYSNNGSNYDYFLDTNRKFRDPSAWYHIVCAFDSTQSTSSNRMKIYINGVQETLFSTETYPGSYSDYAFNNIVHEIGQDVGAGSRFFDGSMSHFYGIDGTAYAASTFGSTDSTTGEWTINTSPSVTMGTNGFTILKDGNTITDQSSNSNNWSLGGGAIIKTQDCPDNVFCTMNPLDNFRAAGTFSNGNNTVVSRNAGYSYNTSTIGVNKGKFYWESKFAATPTGSGASVQIGIAKQQTTSATNFLGSNLFSYAYQGDSGAVRHNDSTVIGYSSYAIGDIIGIALDMDNNRLYFSKNGTFQNSSNPANGTNPISILAADSTPLDTGFYFAGFGDGNDNLQQTAQFNFGNGYFGTTAVSSAGTNASGNGIFEYAVPSGYTALSTKGLNL